jgi:hypothetical protein
VQSACNRAKWAHPFDSNAPNMEAQAHTSCNRRADCYVRATAPPLADSRLEGGVNRAKLKFKNNHNYKPGLALVIINESAREGAKQIASK